MGSGGFIAQNSKFQCQKSTVLLLLLRLLAIAAAVVSAQWYNGACRIAVYHVSQGRRSFAANSLLAQGLGLWHEDEGFSHSVWASSARVFEWAAVATSAAF